MDRPPRRPRPTLTRRRPTAYPKASPPSHQFRALPAYLIPDAPTCHPDQPTHRLIGRQPRFAAPPPSVRMNTAEAATSKITRSKSPRPTSERSAPQLAIFRTPRARSCPPPCTRSPSSPRCLRSVPMHAFVSVNAPPPSPCACSPQQRPVSIYAMAPIPAPPQVPRTRSLPSPPRISLPCARLLARNSASSPRPSPCTRSPLPPCCFSLQSLCTRSFPSPAPRQPPVHAFAPNLRAASVSVHALTFIPAPSPRPSSCTRSRPCRYPHAFRHAGCG